MSPRPACAAAVLVCLAACSTGGLGGFGGPATLEQQRGTPYAPTLDPRGAEVDQLLVGHRLMQAGEAELALEAYTRAAGSNGLTAEVLSSLGSANLALGRLGQAETLLRRAVEVEPTWPEAWNNLGVVLIESGQTSEAAEIFRRAYALDNGESDAIRDNLRLALAKRDDTGYDPAQNQDYRLVRRGSGDFLIRRDG
ncbi:tetratricopeptide repeat protein [Salipiger mangrovisoli]|uniref:Tetratricopeptide repeat protein n=1 Tax=Salipiger mangrovisoli TaxID=2865933 RepID=A0ABR9X8K2_9RHOB|nr:tetratricopeptide repeat protein [Salipiger mangrovisoli]MBE9639878.1 tetratricopeptide repeat protein [Salipiger mangrovisoli]